MKKLSFVFKSGDEIIVNEKCTYNFADNVLSIEYKNFIVRIKKERDYSMFVRETEDDVLKIEKRGNVSRGYIKLNIPEIQVDIKVLEFSVEKNEKGYNIKYLIESDTENEKNIIITLNE